MHVIPFFVWIILFSIVTGVISGLKASTPNVECSKLFDRKIEFYRGIRSVLIIFLLIMALFIPLNAFLPLCLIAPFSWYFFHDGTYFVTRSHNDVPSWNWKTTTSSIYLQRFSISYQVRLRMFVLSVISIIGIMVGMG